MRLKLDENLGRGAIALRQAGPRPGGCGAWLEEEIEPHEIGVFVQSKEQPDRGTAAVALAGAPYVLLDDKLEILNGRDAGGRSLSRTCARRP